jgi:hypothetical protein
MFEVLNDPPFIFCISVDIFRPSETVLSALNFAVVAFVGDMKSR